MMMNQKSLLVYGCEQDWWQRGLEGMVATAKPFFVGKFRHRPKRYHFSLEVATTPWGAQHIKILALLLKDLSHHLVSPVGTWKIKEAWF